MCIYCTTNNYRKIYENHVGPIPKDDQGRSYHVHHIDGDHSNNNPANLIAVSPQEHYDIHYAQGDWAACHRLAFKLGLSSQEISELARRTALQRVKDGTHNFLGPANNQKRVENGTHPFLAGGLAQAINKQRFDDGTHHFLREDFKEKCRETLRRTNSQRLKDGTHHFLGGEIQRRNAQKRVMDGTHNLLGGEISRRNARKRVADGTHHFLNGEISRRNASNNARKRVADGTHHLLGPEHNQRRIDDGSHNFLVEHTCPHCGKVGKSASMFYWHFDRCKHKMK